VIPLLGQVIDVRVSHVEDDSVCCRQHRTIRSNDAIGDRASIPLEREKIIFDTEKGSPE
jgi:hypothetical protein